MNQKRKRLGLWILFLAALLLTQFTVPVKASEPQIQDVNIQMVGGQIRTIDPMGLRMVACIKKSYIQELEKSGATVSYGIVLLPKKYLTEGQALTLDGKYLYNGSVYKPAKVPAVKKFSEDNERIYFTAVLANLPKERYKNDYAARAYAEITRTVIEDDGKKKTTTEVVYSESEIDRQVYRIAEEAVNGTTEAEETKQWLRDNILAPVDTPEELPEEEKKISFRLGKVSGVTLYHKTTSEAGVETVEEVSQFNLTEFKKEDYLVKVEMEDQPEIFAGITEVIAPQTETGKVSFKLDRKDYTTSQAGQTIEGAVVEFGTKSNDKVSTKYITMQALIDQMKANPSGTYTLEHDIDASMVQASESLVPTFSGTFNGNGYKIKGLTSTLFGTVSNGKIENVKLENVSITKSMSDSFKDAGAGTLANKAASNTVIENVHVNGSLRNPNTRSLLGGLVGRMDHAKISKCSANVEISGSLNTTGGLVGQMSNNTTGPNIIENSYAVGTISGTQVNGAVGGLIGWHNSRQSGSVTNCYAAVTVKITKSGNVKDPGGLIGYIGNSDSTGIIKSNVSFSTGTSGYKFDGSTENTKYTSAQTEKLYSLRESSLKRESSRTGNTNLTQITDVTVDKLSQKEFYTNMGWSEDVWDFAPLKEGKTPILRNNDSNMTTMLQTKEIASAADLKNIKNDLSGVYVLTTDIDISESASGTAVIPGIFKGTLKGNGHQIIGQKIPLFDTLDGATIENVKLVQGEINQKGSYDNFVDVAENGAQSINKSKFLIVDSSANKDHSQDVFQEFYKPLQTMWKSNNGAVAVIFGNPNYDYIYYNSSNFIGDLTVLNHEMGHVTDMWIWMENKGKRPGRNGEDYSNGFANQANVDYNMNFMKTYARDGSMLTNLTPDRINTQEEFKSYYKEVFETIYTLDYLQGKAYLELTPAQQSAITSQHRYGTTNNYQSRNQSNSTWRTIGAAELENMNLKTLDDLWDNQLTIRPGHRFGLRSMNDVGVNNLGAYQIDRVCYASWYVPYVDGGTPNAQTFRRNGYELGGLYGYSDGLVEYLSNRTQTGDLAYFKKKMQDENFSFETYRKNKNKEIEEKIKKQKEQDNAYFDEEALIEYLKQNMINYGNGINSGVSTGNNTLNNIKESRENVFRYLQRITDEFRSPVYADTAESRHAVTISTGQELIEKINENPNGFYVLEKDISMADINLTGEVYIDKTFIGKLQGNGHKITDAQGPLFAKIANSYVSDLTIVNKEGETKDWFGKTKQYTIIVNEQKKETVQEIKTLEELQTVGQNKYTKYVLKNDIDASTATTGKAVAEGVFKGEFDGGGFTIKGLKKPLFEKVQEGTVRNLKIENAEINSTEESSKNAVITKESNHAVFESLNLADIKVSGVSYNAVVTGYDYTSSVFSKIQIRNAQITGTKNYNAVLAGRASGSQIQDVAVIGKRRKN